MTSRKKFVDKIKSTEYKIQQTPDEFEEKYNNDDCSDEKDSMPNIPEEFEKIHNVNDYPGNKTVG